MLADVVSEVDAKESRNSESSNDSQVLNSGHKFGELLSKSAQSKGNKSAPKFSNKDSDSEEKETEEDEVDKDKLNPKDFDRWFKGIKPGNQEARFNRLQLKETLAKFEIFVDWMKVPAKTKMIMLKKFSIWQTITSC